ncbi:MAG: hypothetical protein JSS65_05430 [Armatimonadetes bacterium]|nr:hypothetical protein [Armatimonadota bacterium]
MKGVLVLGLCAVGILATGCADTGSDLTKEDKVKMDKLFREGVKPPGKDSSKPAAPSGPTAEAGQPINAADK